MTPTTASFSSVVPKKIRVIGVPLDLGQSRRGVAAFVERGAQRVLDRARTVHPHLQHAHILLDVGFAR